MKMNKILDYLDEMIPNPVCELNYTKDYELLIAIVLSAQSTDKRVNKTTPILFNKYKSIEELKNASLEDVEKIIMPIGSYHKKADYIISLSKIVCDKYNGIIPRDRNLLITLPGVGRKTANVFLSEYYNEAAIAVDTHVERVSKRLGLALSKDTPLKVEEKLMKKIKKEQWSKRHLQLVLFGRYHCKAIKPNCSSCKLIDFCKEKRKS